MYVCTYARACVCVCVCERPTVNKIVFQTNANVLKCL